MVVATGCKAEPGPRLLQACCSQLEPANEGVDEGGFSQMTTVIILQRNYDKEARQAAKGGLTYWLQT